MPTGDSKSRLRLDGAPVKAGLIASPVTGGAGNREYLLGGQHD